MDDCCRIGEMLPPPSGEAAGRTHHRHPFRSMSTIELSVSAVYTANPLTGDGVSIFDVEYISSRLLQR